VPALVASSIICLALGAAGGVAAMGVFGYHWEPKPKDTSGEPEGGAAAMMAKMGGPAMGRSGGPPGMGGGRGMGGGPPGMGGFGQPDPRGQLATLVAKLDVLTRKPLTVQLTEEQKTKVREQLRGLQDADSLSEEDAKKRLDALLDVVKDQRDTLEDAGYRWPGGGGGGFRPPANAPNPFKEGKTGEHLKSLEDRLGKAKEQAE
jgi:hypothetical protein